VLLVCYAGDCHHLFDFGAFFAGLMPLNRFIALKDCADLLAVVPLL